MKYLDAYSGAHQRLQDLGSDADFPQDPIADQENLPCTQPAGDVAELLDGVSTEHQLTRGMEGKSRSHGSSCWLPLSYQDCNSAQVLPILFFVYSQPLYHN